MDIKRKNELLSLHLGGIVQIDKADGKLKPWQSTSQEIERMMQQLDKNTEPYVLLTLKETIDAVKNLCGPNPNSSWKNAAFSCLDIVTSFTGNIIDAYGFGRLAHELSGNFGVRVTQYIDKYGNLSIKLTGRIGVRNFLTAAKYGANHWKMIDMGIGTKGIRHGIIDGARKVVFVAAAYRLFELALRDEYDIYNFFGNITMDVAKTAIGVWAGMGAGAAAGVFLTGGTYALAVSFGVFALGFAVAYGLYFLDNKYEMSKRLIEYMRENELSEAKKLGYRKQPLGYPYPWIK